MVDFSGQRWSDAHAEATARAFAASRFAELWTAFGIDIQRALVDAWIMEQLQWAHVGDSTMTLTATQIVEFRDLVRDKLAAGVVPAGRRGNHMRVSFQVQL
jgi:hypothetical protein